MIKKSTLATYLVVLIFISQFGVFYLTPFALFDTLFSTLFSILGFSLIIIKPKQYSKIFKSWIFIFLGLILMSTLTAYYHLNQDILSSLIANRPYFELGSVIFVYYLIQRYYLDLNFLLKLLRKVGWILFIIFLVMTILNIEFNFTSPFTGSTLEMSQAKMSKTLINFISVLYLGYYFYERNPKYLFYSLILFSANMFGDFQRFVFLAYLVALLSGFLIFRKTRVALQLIPFGLIILFSGLIFLSYTDYGAEVQKKFQDAIKIVEFKSDASDDASVNARVWESEYALEEFKKSPIFGNGLPRANEKEELYGELYFYLSDIGLIGVLYGLGIVGLLVYIFQLKQINKFEPLTKNALGLKLFLVFVLFISILTGYSILKPGVFMCLILLYEFVIKKEDLLKELNYA